jgi:hypothetical protein
MKIHVYAFVALCSLMLACGEKTAANNPETETLDPSTLDSIPQAKNRPRPLPPTPYSQVMKTKPFAGKVASKNDVQKNGAIFSFSPPKGTPQSALPLRMPLMVFWDRHPNQDTILFVVQCERLGADTMVGWVNGWGKSGLSPLRELIHAQEQRRIDQRDFNNK